MGKNIDDELAAVAGIDSDESAADREPDKAATDDNTMAVPDPAEPRAPAEDSGPSTNLGFLVTLLVMAAGIVVLFMFGFKEAAIYSQPVDDIIDKSDELRGRRVRLEGELVPGTLTKRDAPCEYRFVIRGKNKQLPIRYSQCVIPDTFRDVPEGGVLVTVEGALAKEGHFEASMIMAKCSSKYDPKTHSMDDLAEAAGSASPSLSGPSLSGALDPVKGAAPPPRSP